MKKVLRRILIIGLSVLGLLLVLFLCGFGRKVLSVNQVEKIHLTAMGQSGETTVELEPEDVRKFVNRYNLSRYVGLVDAEHCDHTFFVRMELKDGSSINILDHEGQRMKVSCEEQESFWVDNVFLLHTVRTLAKEYGLTLENLGC